MDTTESNTETKSVADEMRAFEENRISPEMVEVYRRKTARDDDANDITANAASECRADH